jgi:multiple sugar transport system ATP-binding protein
MRVELAELQRRLGTTTVYVTHDQEEAMTLGHRIVVMKDGVVQQVDTPERLYARPRNAFVARFTGSPAMNVFPGALRAAGDRLAFEPDGGGPELEVPAPWRAALRSRAGRRVLLGVRPEDIGVHGAPGPGAGGVEVEIEASAVEMLGPQRLVYFRLGGALGVASLAPDVPVRATERVRTVWAARKLHFFDGDTEERLEAETEAAPSSPAASS